MIRLVDKFLLGGFFGLLVLFPAEATSDNEYQPGPFEKAPTEKIECDWSKLNYEQAKECRKRRDFFNNMTPEEKEKYNEEVERRIMQENIRRLDNRTR